MKVALGIVVMLSLLLAACGALTVTPQRPPDIVYGEDVCEHCGMIINDERFAAGMVVETEPEKYEHRIFDDIGDMFAYARTLEEEGNSATIVRYFVHDYQSHEWLEAQQAHFVKAEPSITAMGSGLVAFSSREQAEAQALAWQGTVLSFETVRGQATMHHEHAAH